MFRRIHEVYLRICSSCFIFVFTCFSVSVTHFIKRSLFPLFKLFKLFIVVKLTPGPSIKFLFVSNHWAIVVLVVCVVCNATVSSGQSTVCNTITHNPALFLTLSGRSSKGNMAAGVLTGGEMKRVFI